VSARLKRIRLLAVPYLRGNPWLAALGVAALAASVGCLCWSGRAKAYHVRLGAGVELKYRKELLKVLCEEAADHDLKIDIQPNSPAADPISRVARGELDAAVIPAGAAVPNDAIRQVAVFECEPLQLFVRPSLIAGGIAALKGRRLNLGPASSGVRTVAGEVLKFIGMKAGSDYGDTAYSYSQLTALPAAQRPDAVFSLSPLPSPLGEWLVQQCGYQLMELPFGAALALRKPTIEDTCIPAHTYSVYPAVPPLPLHTVGTRGLLIAHENVSKIAIRRLLEVFYQSDFARRLGMPPLDESLIVRSGQYPNHPGTIAYLHRQDPWVSKDLVENLKSLSGMLVSAASALILFWQWYRRRNAVNLSDYLRLGTQLEMEALQAGSGGPCGDGQLEIFQQRLTALRIEVLEKHNDGLLPGDQQFANLLARLDNLQRELPVLLRSAARPEPATLALPGALRQAG
jgi:TRAP-type uncharacterized transport system substrate-binding protein